MHTKTCKHFGLWIVSLAILAALAVSSISCSDSPTEGNSKNDPALIGTWNLTSFNGQSIPYGVYLTWSFTAETVTITSDLDCVEVGRYSSEGGVLRGLSIISREGTQCGDDDTIGELGPYSVAGNKLTVTITDPDMDPPTGVFVFTKVN